MDQLRVIMKIMGTPSEELIRQYTNVQVLRSFLNPLMPTVAIWVQL